MRRDVLETDMLKQTAALVAVLAIFGGSVQAATLKGEAMVNRGDGFAPQAGGTVTAGDRVMVSRDGGATVEFADGCAVQLQPAQVLAVTEESPCQNGADARAVDFSGRMGQQTTPPAGDIPPLAVIGGVAAVGLGVWGIVALTRGSSSHSR